MADPAKAVATELLAEISRLQTDENVWMALPMEVDTWWRQRSQMTLIPDGNTWKIKGTGAERARVGHVFLDGDSVHYEAS